MIRNIKDFFKYDHSKINALIRVDFNVPILDGKILDYSRLSAAKASIDLLKDKCKRVVIVSHFGRPNGKYSEEFSLRHIVEQISDFYGEKIEFAQSIDDINKINSGLVLLENIRFFPEEEKNDINFAKMLAQLADIYVNEAFSCSHRMHSSIHAITNYIESYAGIACFEEVNALNKLLSGNGANIMAIIGGSKISSKIGVLESLLDKGATIAIGGAMANTFLKASGLKIGRSVYEEYAMEIASSILEKHKDKIILPEDFICKNGDRIYVRNLESIEDNDMIMDIGPACCIKICNAIKVANTIVWNGPLGKFEEREFRQGTQFIANFITIVGNKVLSIIGGGDTLACLALSKIENKFSHVSTAGGAFLEWLEKGNLPCIEALSLDWRKINSHL